MSNFRRLITFCFMMVALNSALSFTWATPPNIILVMADDLGWKELGCYGQTKIRTPNIDQMAAEGMRFNQFYAGAPVCAPARCNLMTGKHAGHAYIRSNHEMKELQREVNGVTIYGGQYPLAEEETTIAELLKSKGYTTGCFGKWGLGGAATAGDPLKQGFDRFYGYNCQRNAHNLYPNYLHRDNKPEFLEGNTRGLTGDKFAPQLIADEMLKFVEENHGGPFFAYYPTVLPHLALQAPQEDIDAYIGAWDETPYNGKRYLPHPTPRACYAAMISFVDKQMGRLFKLLKEKGIDDNTIVIFTSDNGPTALNQVDTEFFDSVGQLRDFKGSVYEGGLRVPFIARWPAKIPPGAKSDLIGAHYDILPTLMEVAGAESPSNTDGISVLSELTGNSAAQKKHDFLLWDFAGYGGQIAVRVGNWKGVKRKVGKNPEARIELYNLDSDLSEQNNVAKQHPEVIARLESVIQRERVVPVVEDFRFGTYGTER